MNYCSGNIEDCLYLLYCKYFNLPYPFHHHNVNCTDEELDEQRSDEKSSLESIYENCFKEKVKNTVWILNLKLSYLVELFCKNGKSGKNAHQTKVKKKEKCKLWIRGHCKYGDKCRFSHEEEEVKNDGLEDQIFELEVRFPPNSKYPYEPPLIFFRNNEILPPQIHLKICKRLFDEAESYAKDGIPSIYTITELLQNSQEITEYLKKDINFLNPKVKLFEETKAVKLFKQKSSHYKKGVTNKDNKRNNSEDDVLRENKTIVDKFLRKMDTKEYKVMLTARRKLPVWNYMNDILNTIESSQVSYEYR